MKNKFIFINLITLSRILALGLLFIEDQAYILLTAIYVAFSDFLDGFLARRWNLKSTFGAKFDQYADKIVALTFMLFFLYNKQISILYIGIVILRELLTTFFRHWKLISSESNFFGKAKSFFLYSLFVLLSINMLFKSVFFEIKMIIMVLVVIFSWLSFVISFIENKSSIAFFVGTSCYTALVFKKAPGTVTSFLAFVIFFIALNTISIEYKICIAITLLIFHFSYFKSFLENIESGNDDPKLYTLDETIAISFAWLILSDLTLMETLAMFFLFRFFDILKPLGIKSLENNLRLTAAFRNVIDDFLAISYSIGIFIIIQLYVR